MLQCSSSYFATGWAVGGKLWAPPSHVIYSMCKRIIHSFLSLVSVDWIRSEVNTFAWLVCIANIQRFRLQKGVGLNTRALYLHLNFPFYCRKYEDKKEGERTRDRKKLSKSANKTANELYNMIVMSNICFLHWNVWASLYVCSCDEYSIRYMLNACASLCSHCAGDSNYVKCNTEMA